MLNLISFICWFLLLLISLIILPWNCSRAFSTYSGVIFFVSEDSRSVIFQRVFFYTSFVVFSNSLIFLLVFIYKSFNLFRTLSHSSSVYFLEVLVFFLRKSFTFSLVSKLSNRLERLSTLWFVFLVVSSKNWRAELYLRYHWSGWWDCWKDH